MKTPQRTAAMRAAGGGLRAFVLMSTVLGASAHAQDLVVEEPAQSRPVAIVDATIHPMVEGQEALVGTVVFEDGRITRVGRSTKQALPPGTRRVDGRGLHVWPGLVGARTTVGLSEIGSLRDTVDTRELNTFSPEARAAVAINPDSTVIPVTRTNGVLTVGTFPEGGLIPGRAAVAELAGWTWEDMAIRPDAGVVVSWPSRRSRFSRFRGGGDGNRAEERRREIDAFFAEARAWGLARANDETVGFDLRFEALQPVLRRERPVFLLADGMEAIESAVHWAQDFGLRPVVVGAEECDLAIDFLAREKVPVILDGTFRLPSRRDAVHHEPFSLPARLHAAGVDFCLASGESFYNERNLPYAAAKAVAYGLPLEAAHAAVTRNAARILGLGDELGTLETGKRATLILTDGDPLEMRTRVVAAWISGRRVNLDTKQFALARKYEEKYRQLGLWPDGARADAGAGGGGK